jgi:hypothetical protein
MATGLTFIHGIWHDKSGSMSSSYWELSNLVRTLEEGLASAQLHHMEVWIFTDNSASEAVFWRGHSSSPLLNSLVLQLRKLELTELLRIHMVHIPGPT